MQRLQSHARAAARLEGRLADVQEGPGREPRRDRAAHLPHSSSPGHRLGGGAIPTADAGALFVAGADEAVEIGGAAPAESYLDADRIFEAVAPHRRRGDSSRLRLFGREPRVGGALRADGVVFIGPTSEQMRAFGLKHTARALATEARLPLLPGTGLLADLAEAQAAATRDRLSGDAQEHGRRRRHRDAPLRERRRAWRGVRLGRAAGGRAFQGQGRLPGEAGRSRPPRGGADLRRRRRPRPGARPARLFAPAPQPEGRRGDPATGALRRDARRSRRGGRSPGRGCALSFGGHGGVRARSARLSASTSSR